MAPSFGSVFIAQRTMLPEAIIKEVKKVSKDDEGKEWVEVLAALIDRETGEETDSDCIAIGFPVECSMDRTQLAKCKGIAFAFLEMAEPINGFYNVALPLDNQSTHTRHEVLDRLTRKRKKFSLDLDKETFELLQNYRLKRRMEVIENLEKIYLNENGERPADDSSTHG